MLRRRRSNSRKVVKAAAYAVYAHMRYMLVERRRAAGIVGELKKQRQHVQHEEQGLSVRRVQLMQTRCVQVTKRRKSGVVQAQQPRQPCELHESARGRLAVRASSRRERRTVRNQRRGRSSRSAAVREKAARPAARFKRARLLARVHAVRTGRVAQAERRKQNGIAAAWRQQAARRHQPSHVRRSVC